MKTLARIESSKETIKARMLRSAADFWGVKNIETLDPLVKLLIEAFSTEIHKAVNEIHSMEVRILDKTARLLTPDFLTMPRPAHAIVHAYPPDATHTLHPFTELHFSKRASSKPNGLPDDFDKVTFTPVDGVKLFHGKVAYMASGYRLYDTDADFNKNIIAQVNSEEPLPRNCMWLGLDLSEDIENTEGLSFYFDQSNYEHKGELYELLEIAEVYLGEEQIPHTHGLTYAENNREQDKGDLLSDYRIMKAVIDDIKTIYRKKFITLTGTPSSLRSQNIRQHYPPEFVNYFDQKVLDSMRKPLLWLLIKLPAPYDYQILEELKICMNAFPVINRKYNSSSHHFRLINNIVPLEVKEKEWFLSVESVTDGRGDRYTEVPYRQSSENRPGMYSVRINGTERFDKRNALDFLNYLMELIRDEIAAFATFGQDFIISTVHDLARQIKQLESKINRTSSSVEEIPTYLVVEPREGDDEVHVEYWTTHCGFANGIRKGTRLYQAVGTTLATESIMMLTTSHGGRNGLKQNERLDAYRYALTTRNRLVTTEDIKNFCRYELGMRIRNVKIEKGLAVSAHPKEGVVRTLDVKLMPAAGWELNKEEWNVICESLLAKIRARAFDGIRYRVMTEN